MSPFRLPLIRLLAVNLAIGIAAAVLMLGGLLALIPRLRTLIAQDPAGLTAAGLLLFGLVVTFGSVAMGTAVMALGRERTKRGGPGGRVQPVRVRVRVLSSPGLSRRSR